MNHLGILFALLAIIQAVTVTAQSRKLLLSELHQNQVDYIETNGFGSSQLTLKSEAKKYFDARNFKLMEETESRLKFATKILSHYFIPRTDQNTYKKSTRKMVHSGQTVYVEVSFEEEGEIVFVDTEIQKGDYSDTRAYGNSQVDGEIPFNKTHFILALYTSTANKNPPISEELVEKVQAFNFTKKSEESKLIAGRDY